MEKIITVYAEQTPNPEALKFVTNQIISRGGSFDFAEQPTIERSPMAHELFKFDFVKGIFIAQDYITVTKVADRNWAELLPILRKFIKDYISAGNVVVTDALMSEMPSFAPEDADNETVTKIKEILANNVRPVVEGDGGMIDYKSFVDGIVTLSLRGSCSGCPSSTVTLKNGIEALMKRLIPEVKEVVAEAL
jgi:Fe-S cluster biogenesis protein NfuA